MLKECCVDELSGFNFLRLLVSTMVVQDFNRIFDNYELERQLFEFYNEDEYHFLFESISTDVSKINNERIILDDAFQFAYAFSILTYISDGRSIRSAINLSENEALDIISNFGERQVGAMDSLCQILKSRKVNPLKGKIYLMKNEKNNFE